MEDARFDITGKVAQPKFAQVDMPLQNRVTPTGDIIATAHRGMFTGNRGIIHDPATKTLVEKALVEPGLDHLRLRVQGLAAQGDGWA